MGLPRGIVSQRCLLFLTVKEMSCCMGFDITIRAAVVVDCANSFCVRFEIGRVATSQLRKSMPVASRD